MTVFGLGLAGSLHGVTLMIRVSIISSPSHTKRRKKILVADNIFLILNSFSVSTIQLTSSN